MGPDIVYVSGRIRKSGEMNGKSANLNNCLSHIYPVGTPIPANEITCIFDADQVCPPLSSLCYGLHIFSYGVLTCLSHYCTREHQGTNTTGEGSVV